MKTWLRQTGVVAVCVLSAGVLLAGCFPGAATLPYTLYMDSDTPTTHDAVTVTLNNPLGHSLFLPSVWNGIAFFYRLPSGQWAEFNSPDGYQPMLTTADTRISYTVPAGFLDPGSYKLVLQGRRGSEGVPFTLEASLEVRSQLIDLGLLQDPKDNSMPQILSPRS